MIRRESNNHEGRGPGISLRFGWWSGDNYRNTWREERQAWRFSCIANRVNGSRAVPSSARTLLSGSTRLADTAEPGVRSPAIPGAGPFRETARQYQFTNVPGRFPPRPALAFFPGPFFPDRSSSRATSIAALFSLHRTDRLEPAAC